jgi:hypothetical protein
MRLATFRRLATANEPASYVFTFSKSTTAATAGIAAYRGVDPTAPIDAHGAQVTSKAATRGTAPSIAVTTQGATLIVVFGSASDVTATAAIGMTERYDLMSGGSSKVAIAGDDERLTASGSTGARTATLSKSTTSIGQSISLRRAP